MLDFHSHQVSIRVNYQDLPIYQPEYDEDTKTVTAWIASEAGQNYSIYCQQDNSVSYTTSARVYLDGSNTECHRALFGKDYGRSILVGGVRVSPTARCPFQFGSLETTDDDAYLDQPPDFKAPGTIRVQMYRVQVIGRSLWKPNRLPQTSSIVHERSKKAGGHITKFGKQEICGYAPQSLVVRPYTHLDVNPWVTFEFRYRPAAILQAEGIIPRPQAFRIDNQLHGEGRDEKEAQNKAGTLALEVKQAELSERGPNLKTKPRTLGVKRAGSPIRVPRSAMVEVIDLTLED